MAHNNNQKSLYPSETTIREYRFKMLNIDLTNKNFKYIMKYNEATLEIYDDTKVIKDLEYYDIIELNIPELNSDSFGFMGNKFTLSDYSINISNIPSALKIDDKTGRTVVIELKLYPITTDGSAHLLYKIQVGGEDPQKFYDEISNNDEYTRNEMFAWIRNFSEMIHSDYDEIKDDLIVLSKLQ